MDKGAGLGQKGRHVLANYIKCQLLILFKINMAHQACTQCSPLCCSASYSDFSIIQVLVFEAS